MLKEGDFIKVKQNTKLESGEIVNDWAGEVQEVYEADNCFLIRFDTQTMNSLDDAYLRGCIEEGADPFEYIFDFDDLELAPRRDTEEQLKKALDNLLGRLGNLEEDEEDSNEALREAWINEFTKSKYFGGQTKYQEKNSEFIIDSFMEFMYNYESAGPKGWTPYNVDEICLNVIPRKVTAEIEFFENFGTVLQRFMKFLKEKKYIKNADAIIKKLEEITPKIVVEAKNPNNWGMAKSMMMGAQNSGVDLSSKESLHDFLRNLNSEDPF